MAESFKNLKVWNDSISLSTDVYLTTKKFPKDEIFGMTSQIRRAVVSISSNIAEGSGRSSKKEFARFIDISIGSLNEVESLLQVSFNLKYLTNTEYDIFINKVRDLGKLLGGFRKYLLAIKK